MTNTNKRIVDPLAQNHGVRGWLVLFIVSLTFLGPLRLLSDIQKESEYLARYFERAPRLPTIVLISNIIMACVIVFSFYTGVSLLKKWRKAVRVAKMFLVSSFIIFIILPFLPLTVDIPESLRDQILDQAWYLPIQLIYPLVWYAYLTYSKRVAATYNS